MTESPYVVRFVANRSDGALRTMSRMLFSRSWRKFLSAVDDPRKAQQKRLEQILRWAKDTEFGREHRFSDIDGFDDFRERVPIRGYDGFVERAARMVRGEQNVLVPERPFFFALTSGTTGVPKYIPITKRYLAEYRRPRRVWLRQIMQAFPGLVRGKILTVHSPQITERTSQNIPCGSITVAVAGSPDAPELGERKDLGMEPVPKRAFLLEDFATRYYLLLRMAAQEDISLVAAVNPSTIVLLSKKLTELADTIARDLEAGTVSGAGSLGQPLAAEIAQRVRKAPEAAKRLLASRDRHGFVRPTDLWPNVQGLLCWKGGSAPFYLSQLETYFPGRDVMDYGYVATEGGFSIPLSPEGARGVVAVHGHVLEFVPEDVRAAGGDRPVFLADELQIGARYRVIVTASNGLYRYDINDVVECVGRFGNAAEIAFVHKGGNMLSITGEKIGESHVVQAFRRACDETGLVLDGFTVTVELSDPPRYLFGVEPQRPLGQEEQRRLLATVEAAMRTVNIEYAAKRDSQRLGEPALKILRAGAFEADRKARVMAGAPDSHVKPRHLLKSVQELEAMGIAPDSESP